ncbi:GSCOCG00009531001-RA-CDS [Cotesia congregata]|nr:GSCOCG00009531001-RA-CDS [Cotesia congregata]
MEEEDSIFDPTLKKKKKKKKTTFDLDAASGEAGSGNEANEGVTDKENQEPEQQLPEDDDALDLENFGKKKKKKKKTFNLDDGDNAVSDNKKEDATESRTEEVAADDNLDLDMDFSKTKKKKKSKKKDFDELIAKEDKKDNDDKDNAHQADSEIAYDSKVYICMHYIRYNRPCLFSNSRNSIRLRNESNLKIFENYKNFHFYCISICKTLHRQPKHLLDFLLAELGTSGSVDGNSQLIIKGRFQQKQIENVLRRYIKEYVTCHTCRSPDTILQKDTRLFFLQCETCGSRCSVASIKSGFQAVTGKRAAIRAKTA